MLIRNYFVGFIPFSTLSFLAVIVSISVLVKSDTAHANQLAKSHYLNTAYCVGVVDAYGEAMSNNGLRSASRRASSLRGKLVRILNVLASQHRLHDVNTKKPQQHGYKVMSGLLPRGISSVEAVSRQATQQLEHCAILTTY